MNFVLAMVLNPEVQRKAQEELDEVVGRERMPELADAELLPYTKSICKETHRWHPVLPLGVPHATNEEDEYNGIRIPRGSAVVPNVW